MYCRCNANVPRFHRAAQVYGIVTRDTSGTFLTLSSKATKKKAAAFRIKVNDRAVRRV